MILYPHNYFNKLIRISSKRDYISLKESFRNKLSCFYPIRYFFRLSVNRRKKPVLFNMYKQEQKDIVNGKIRMQEKRHISMSEKLHSYFFFFQKYDILLSVGGISL